MVMYVATMENDGPHHANRYHALSLFDADKVTLSDFDALKIRALTAGIASRAGRV
ncbi:hypothetical protein P3T42_007301 [Paraburkholderia sp. GAS38]